MKGEYPHQTYDFLVELVAVFRNLVLVLPARRRRDVKDDTVLRTGHDLRLSGVDIDQLLVLEAVNSLIDLLSRELAVPLHRLAIRGDGVPAPGHTSSRHCDAGHEQDGEQGRHGELLWSGECRVMSDGNNNVF